MYRSFEARKELAERIYELDAEVYAILGSGLGRVFNGQRERTINNLAGVIANRSQMHLLRSEIALIGNMARTIPDRKVRAQVMEKYEAVLKEIKGLVDSFGDEDILDEDIARMNRINLSGRFGEVDHLIVCISRTYGSAGTDIGFALADKLGLGYYDNEIFTEVMDRLKISLS